jgi:D-alanyl-D-alanine dipeptidase
LTLVPQAGLGIAMVATMDATNEVVVRLCQYALRLALAAQGHVPMPRTPRLLPPSTADQLERLFGHYGAADGSAIELRPRDGRLLLVDRGLPVELRPLDGRRFVVDGRIHGEGSAYPASILDWDGADGLVWSDHQWRRTEGGPVDVPAELASHLGTYAPAFLPSRLIASGGGLVCVMEEFFPHACTRIGDGRYILGPGMYEDEILEIGITSAMGRPAMRLGEMLLERLD